MTTNSTNARACSFFLAYFSISVCSKAPRHQQPTLPAYPYISLLDHPFLFPNTILFSPWSVWLKSRRPWLCSKKPNISRSVEDNLHCVRSLHVKEPLMVAVLRLSPGLSVSTATEEPYPLLIALAQSITPRKCGKISSVCWRSSVVTTVWSPSWRQPTLLRFPALFFLSCPCD